MRRAGGMDRERLGVADVGEVAEQLEPLDKLAAGLKAALHAEADEPAEAAGQILLGERVGRAALQAGIVHPGHAVVALEELGDLERVGAAALHAEMQRLQTLEHEEGVERADARADVAQELQPHLHDVGDVRPAGGSEGLKRVPMADTVVTGVGLAQAGELAVAPVEVAAVHDHAADGGAMAANVFRSRMHDHVAAPLDRAVQHRREAGVVDDGRDAGLTGDGGDLGEREDVEAGIAEPLAVEGLGVRAERLAEILRILAVDEAHLDAKLGQRVMEEVVRAAIELGDGDDVVAGPSDVEDGIGDRGLARAVGERPAAALERGQALLEDVGRRVHQPRVDVAEFLQREEVRRVLGVAEDVTGRLVQGDGAGAGGGIGSLAGVEGAGAEAGDTGGAHGSGQWLGLSQEVPDTKPGKRTVKWFNGSGRDRVTRCRPANGGGCGVRSAAVQGSCASSTFLVCATR